MSYNDLKAIENRNVLFQYKNTSADFFHLINKSIKKNNLLKSLVVNNKDIVYMRI